MRYISTFSGIEAASVAWEPLGWEPMAFSEIDEFPSAVLAHRYPSVPNLGDITKVDWKEFVSGSGRPDVLVGGSPCQSFSLAGGRESLGGESRLMFEFIRACDEVRSPWILWENVCGVLNTRDNAFRQLLDALQGIGYVSLAWRVLDAQFFGVAQRRRRVFLIGHLGTGGGAAAVLFESESVRGNTQTSKQKREALARAAGRGSSAGGSAGFCGYASSTARSIGYAEETAPTLKGNDWQAQVPDVLHATAIRTAQTGANGSGVSDEATHTVDAHGPEAVAYAVRMREGKAGGGKGPLVQTDMSGTIATGNDQTMFVPIDGVGYVVRRLTPTECERLQGFPDGWTDVPFKGKEHPSDTPRYKAIGNSMAVPVMRWIGERIEFVDKIIKEGE
jgi:DNA (cytosine-5)-methyltransferase 1